jgi:putative oxygen-independent coproporphyrinogen III oxidase
MRQLTGEKGELDERAEGSKRATSEGAGVYVHFPYCLAKCPYCDFVSYARERETIDHRGYAEAVLRELSERAPSFADRRIETVFFGGGTPSLWDPRELGRVLRTIRETLSCGDDLEVTVECNPTSIDEERARALVDQGVNRVSIGVQSLCDDRLRALGRLHDAAAARVAVEGALRAVPRVSADLIFGLAGQTPDESRGEAIALCGWGLSHVSCYQLTIEPGTRFGELARLGRLPLADDGAVAEGFLAIDEALGALGYRHYEVSNYAQAGQEARHNLGYWRGHEYLGLGCGAYGFVMHPPRRGGTRYRNEVSPEKYVARTRTGSETSREPLDAPTLMRERIMLGLRMADGIDLDDAARALGTPGWTAEREKTTRWLVDRGRVIREAGRLRVPPGTAWLWTDDTAARLF